MPLLILLVAPRHASSNLFIPPPPANSSGQLLTPPTHPNTTSHLPAPSLLPPSSTTHTSSNFCTRVHALSRTFTHFHARSRTCTHVQTRTRSHTFTARSYMFTRNSYTFTHVYTWSHLLTPHARRCCTHCPFMCLLCSCGLHSENAELDAFPYECLNITQHPHSAPHTSCGSSCLVWGFKPDTLCVPLCFLLRMRPFWTSAPTRQP